jgi:F0F1-type ATP synthase assembly protein I
VRQAPSGGDYLSLGATLAGAFLVPLVAGIGVDAVARTGPLFLMIGLGLGILGAAATAYVRFKRFL